MWSKPVDWFYTLPRQKQINLIAWWRIKHPASQKRRKAKRRVLSRDQEAQAFWMGN